MISSSQYRYDTAKEFQIKIESLSDEYLVEIKKISTKNYRHRLNHVFGVRCNGQRWYYFVVSNNLYIRGGNNRGRGNGNNKITIVVFST